MSAAFPEDQLEELAEMGEVSVVIDGCPMVLITNPRLPAHLTAPKDLALLIYPRARDGYPTRLFFSAVVQGTKQPNWNGNFRYAERMWHAYSFNNVPASLRLAQIVSAHLEALG